MGKKQDSFVEYVQDLLGDVGPIQSRRMFGGYGVYFRGRMFALIAYDQLYMKVDPHLQAEYEDAGSEPFVYESPGRKPIQMSYWRMPEDAMEQPVLAAEWARKSIEAAARAAAQKKPRSLKKKPAGKKATKKAPSRKKGAPPGPDHGDKKSGKKASGKKKSGSKKGGRKKPRTTG
jgi:DNA transformation protein